MIAGQAADGGFVIDADGAASAIKKQSTESPTETAARGPVKVTFGGTVGIDLIAMQRSSAINIQITKICLRSENKMTSLPEITPLDSTHEPRRVVRPRLGMLVVHEGEVRVFARVVRFRLSECAAAVKSNIRSFPRKRIGRQLLSDFLG